MQVNIVVALAAGHSHCAALKGDGKVFVWGIGLPSVTNVPSSATNVVALAAGDFHTVALKDDGTVVAWGDSSHGATTVPYGLTNVVAVAAGTYQSLALKQDGSVVAWGSYFYYTNGYHYDPVTVPYGLSGAAAIAASGNYDLAVAADGPPMITSQLIDRTVVAGSTARFYTTVAGARPLSYQWRLNEADIPDATNAWLLMTNVLPTQGGAYSLMVSNSFGVAISSKSALTVIPLLVTAAPQTRMTALEGTVTFSVTVTGVGVLSYQWLFNGTAIPDATNTSLTLANVRFNQRGGYSVIVRDSYGSSITSSVANLVITPLAVWGDNRSKQFNVPSSATNLVAVSQGGSHELALRRDGRVVAWGSNSYGQTNVPVTATNCVAIAAGGSHSLAIKADGTMIAWGNSLNGQTWIPNNLVLTNVVAVAAGGFHSLALKADGTVAAWGLGEPGSVGSYNYGQATVPKGLTNAVAIAAGIYHSLVLKSDGTVAAWGQGSPATPTGYGQSTVPSGLTGVVAVAAGAFHSLAIKSDGTVVAWGQNVYGQTNVPHDLTNVAAISGGNQHSLALKADGTLVSWGTGSMGETKLDSNLTQVVAIAAGGFDCMALVADGAPFCGARLADRTVVAGTSVCFSVAPTGAWPMNCQWQFNGTNLPGATNAWLVLTNVQACQSGAYTIMVNNAFGTVSSPEGVLTVIPALRFDLTRCGLQAGDGQFHLSVNGPAGTQFILEKSVDLKTWIPVGTNALTEGKLQLPTPTGPVSQFFRMRLPED